MHILGPLLYGRSRALCRLLGSFWTRNRSPVNPIFECLAAPVGSRPSGQPQWESPQLAIPVLSDDLVTQELSSGQLAPDLARAPSAATAWSSTPPKARKMAS